VQFHDAQLGRFGVLGRTKIRFSGVPFVCETSTREEPLIGSVLRLGAYDYLRVPLDREMLLAVAKCALEYRRLKPENRALRAELESLKK
jgi:DNA-binding NtrC family response regulator